MSTVFKVSYQVDGQRQSHWLDGRWLNENSAKDAFTITDIEFAMVA